MPTFNLATITAAQALALTAADTLQIDQGTANATTVLFVPGVGGAADTISLNVGATTAVFGTGLSSATISYADGSRLFVGTPASDAPAAFGATNDGLYGGLGDDTLNAGNGTNQLQGNQGNDLLIGGTGRDVIYGGQGNDQIQVGASASGIAGFENFAQGNKGDDTISGSATDSDILLGGQGNDLIGATGVGPPTLIPEAGINVYINPVGVSGGGNDVLDGNLGNDSIYGGSGNDQILGEDGDDAILGGGGHDTIDAGAGNDIVGYVGGVVVISLGDGNDLCGDLSGGSGSSADHATIDGGAGDDHISGSRGIDSLSGGTGNDTIDGNGGGDTLSGGAGSDLFRIYDGDASTNLAAMVTIVDWEAGDRLDFPNGNTDVSSGPGTSANYVETTMATYSAALTYANAQIAGGVINFVAVAVGGDVFVFGDNLGNNGVADAAVELVGRSLADISFSNIVGP